MSVHSLGRSVGVCALEVDRAQTELSEREHIE